MARRQPRLKVRDSKVPDGWGDYEEDLTEHLAVLLVKLFLKQLDQHHRKHLVAEEKNQPLGRDWECVGGSGEAGKRWSEKW